jgi:hypothetical protein
MTGVKKLNPQFIADESGEVIHSPYRLMHAGSSPKNRMVNR